MYKLIFYVPKHEADQVKEAVFATGAGSIGDYARCSWETLGVGQYMPLKDANPTYGKNGQLEKIEELRVEILCEELNIRPAIVAMKSAHSYEEPAYEVVSIENHKFE